MTALRIDGRRLKDRVRGRRVSFADGLYERWLARHGLRLADLGEQMAYGKDGLPEHVYVQALFDNDFNQVWSDALPKLLVDLRGDPNGYRLKSLMAGLESLGIKAMPPRSWTGTYRRQPKGRRAKSGQWWRRPRVLRMSEIQSTNYPWQTRKNKPMPDWRDRVVIDEAADDSGQVWELLGRLNPKVTSGKVIEATTNDRRDKP